jgi:hypothetical protein
MDRYIIPSVLLIALLGAVGLWLLTPDQPQESSSRLPWQTGLDARGRLQVFGFTLGVTTLADVQQSVGERGRINLFVTAGEEAPFTAEAFFQRIYLDGLRGDFIFTLAVSDDQLLAMHGRGLRIARLGSGAQKVTLAPEDVDTLRRAPIAHLTYLPMARLQPELIERRFGPPAERLAEPHGVIHWLYPERGIDIARDSQGKTVIQYVNPADFSRLREPLAPP